MHHAKFSPIMTASAFPFFYRLAEAPPRHMRHLIRDVRPPAVDSVFRISSTRSRSDIPVPRGLPCQALAYGYTPKTFIIRPAWNRICPVDQKPVVLGDSAPFFHDIAKLLHLHAAVIEHRIQHNPVPVGMRHAHEVPKFFFLSRAADQSAYNPSYHTL